jgi:hypothetical protein
MNHEISNKLDRQAVIALDDMCCHHVRSHVLINDSNVQHTAERDHKTVVSPNPFLQG